MHTWDVSGRVQRAQPPSGTSLFSCGVMPLTWSRSHETPGSVLPVKEGDLMDPTPGGSQGHQRMHCMRRQVPLKAERLGDSVFGKDSLISRFEQFVVFLPASN